MFDEETFQKSRSYNLDKARFGIVRDVLIQAAITTTLVFGLLPTIWNFSGKLTNELRVYNKVQIELCQSMIFVLIITNLILIILSLFELYSMFVIEKKHGFSKQTFGSFIVDGIKDLAISGIICAATILAVIWILKMSRYDIQLRELLKWSGDDFQGIFWCFVLLLVSVMAIIRTELDNIVKCKSLPDGELKTKVEALVGRLGFPAKRIYVVEESKRSSHSNAYFAGPWKFRHIVLFDTIFENCASPLKSNDPEAMNTTDEKATSERKTLGLNDDEVVAVIGHELGHWKLNHIYKILFFLELIFLPVTLGALFPLLYKPSIIRSAFEFTDAHCQSIVIGYTIVFFFVVPAYKEILSFLISAFFRRMEYAADAFSAKHVGAKSMQSALIKLEKDNLGFPLDDWLYSAWYHWHPSLLERLAALKRFE